MFLHTKNSLQFYGRLQKIAPDFNCFNGGAMGVEKMDGAEVTGNGSEKNMTSPQVALLRSFVQNSFSSLDLIESNTLGLEKSHGSIAIIDSIRSSFLAVAESAEDLGLYEISKLSHGAVKFLNQILVGSLLENQEVVETVLTVTALLQTMVQNVSDVVEQGQQAYRKFDITGLVESLASTDCAAGQRSYTGLYKEIKTANRLVEVDESKLADLLGAVKDLGAMQDSLCSNPLFQEISPNSLFATFSPFFETSRQVQEKAASLCKVSLHRVFQKIANYIRDLSRKTGKQVNLIVNGSNAEIGHDLLDLIHDCLVHIVRNAVDHGLGPAGQQEKAGFGRFLTITLSAGRENGHLLIDVADDGQGLNIDKIRDKALDRNLIDSRSSFSEQEIADLVFLPGFSTVDEVTSVSGRGMGLYVVKKEIEALMGKIELKRASGPVTHFVIHLPLSE